MAQAKSVASRPRRPPRKGRWKRGPAAAELASGAEYYIERLGTHPKRFLSLREAAACLDISTQPVRDWIREGLLAADGPRNRIPVANLVALLRGFQHQRLDLKFDHSARAARFHRSGVPRERFAKLRQAEFTWPAGVASLIPSALARLLGCHPSYLIRAIREGELPLRRRSAHRWEIRRKDWKLYVGSGKIARRS